MKIQELEITRTIQRLRDPGEILRKAGWEVLGAGMDGAVAEHPSKPYVLKLFVSNSAYVPFVHYVQTHQSNPHLPRFNRYVKKVPGTHLSYVRMEKLKNLDEDQVIETHPGEVLSLYTIARVYGQWVEPAFVRPLLARLELARLPQLNEIENVCREKNIQPPSQGWLQAVTDLVMMSQSQHLGWDLHLNNVMLRGSTLVITDPFYNEREMSF